MAAIALAGVTKVYPTGTVAVDGIDLEVGEGEFVVLLGPTGCGKTTVLRIVAGLETATDGQVRLDDKVVDHVPARQRRLAMVFQDFALYPHLSVADNIAFPLRNEGIDEAAITARVAEVARQVAVERLLRRRPDQLSGGQRQRVAMARAIVRRPVAFLLDEPLSNVDAAVRAELRGEIVSLTRSLRVGTLYVTHDQTEAMTMADRIAVMRRGRIEQLGTPSEVYGDPQRLFVAAFLGIPRTSLLQAAVYATPGEEAVLDLGTQVIRLPWTDRRAPALAEHHTARITVAIRAEALTIVPDGTDDQTPDGAATGAATAGPVLRGTVVQVEHLGNEAIVSVDVGGVPTAPEVSQLEVPAGRGTLAEAVAETLPASTGGEALRDALSRLVPHSHQTRPPATARTPYGFYPVYEAGEAAPQSASSALQVRIPQPAPVPRRGEPLCLAVDLDQVFLFDHAGDRVRLPGGECGRAGS